ncbi:MAG TPA: cation:proton antiporter [Thermodesulfobacteriota bacterium]|nr:cation:proton antiporter [Thermodesulfobacteriota bacterium]
MDNTYIALIMGLLIFLASIISVKAAISVAIIEIAMGVIGGNFLGLHPTPWIDFLAGFGGILLTFLAGAETDPQLMREKFKESFLIGGISFLAPFLLAFAYCYWIAGWSFKAAEIAGTALSTTSLAVVYAVLVETGLTETKIGKIIMASCFVTDFGTALALSLLFAEGNLFTLLFVIGSAVIIFFSPKIVSPILSRYGNRVIEPEIKFLFLILFLLMYLGKIGASHAVLPVFILGLVLSNTLRSNRDLQRKLRVIAFAMITPFFFIKGGMNVSLNEIYANWGLLLVLFGVKMGAKIIGVYPLAKKYVPENAAYSTLLMSTGLTFGTISSMYGLSAGFINISQFSVLVTVVILTAIIPTFIAQRWFQPSLSEEMEVSGKPVEGISALNLVDQKEGENV